MKLADRLRPQTLADVIGQPVTRHLAAWLTQPDSRCFLFEGGPGVGKTSAALALGADLGSVDECSGLYVVPCSELSIDVARSFFEGNDRHGATMRQRHIEGRGWNVLVLEELEWLSPQTVRYLKVALDDTRRPARCIVIATSNDASALDKALRQRFDVYRFGAGKTFADACTGRLAEIWRDETGQASLPAGWTSWGWDGEDFSLRLALQALERSARLLPQGVAA
jgi:replication factor C small subunit